MTLTLKRKNNVFAGTCAVLLLLCCILATPLPIKAQSVLSLSVTPTLFEMSANPGQKWQSSVKVINSNPYELTVYASVVNFAPEGETGQGKLLPVFAEVTEGTTLAEWVDITDQPIIIPPEESASVPFIVEVPEGASPGGHFAAILISTQPPVPEAGSLAVRTTQVVTSLFFVRIAGDVVEQGAIRSFTTREHIRNVPEANFVLRFENKGNVHIQPRGDITIYNMWGEERGKIPINHQTHFGNVLPDSIRKFEFTWSGERSFADFGRYKAVASLGYGLGSTQFVTSTAYFWVIPLKSMLITIGAIVAFIWFASWAVKLYVRRMLQLAGVPMRSVGPKRHVHTRQVAQNENNDVRISSYHTISAPMRSGYRDFKDRIANASAFFGVIRACLSFVVAYRLFFVSTFVTIVGAFGLYFFIAEVTKDDRSYEVSIENPGQSVALSSEEIAYEELRGAEGVPELGRRDDQSYTISVINTSGESGVGAKAAATLEGKGYAVTDISSKEGRVDKTTTIVFDQSLQTTAIELSQLFGGALVSARTATDTEELPNITIFVGKDQAKKE